MLPPDYLVQLCIWREARGSTPGERLGVLWTLLNRLNVPGHTFGLTLAEVILRPKQFSSFNQDDPNYRHYPRQSAAADWEAWQEILAMCAEEPLPADPTHGATHYFTPPANPAWANPSKMTAQIGAFKFFKGV